MTTLSECHEGWTSLPDMLEHNTRRFGSRPAILGDGGVALNHAELHERVAAALASLRAFGIGRGDRVAIALPQGADMVVAFLAVAAGATAAPLNPAYTKNDFLFHLRDLPARALIVPLGGGAAARAAAEELGVPIVDLEGSAKEGCFSLSGAKQGPPAAPVFAQEDDVALVLHTSGTTARPKRVPLSHGNLCASARNIAATLGLGETDISLAVMPLFHIHGLVASVLAALGAGGSCGCPGAFDAGAFPRWLKTWRPTWFSAVPTMHQALLDVALDSPNGSGSLRFIRSSSAALAPSLMKAMERAFGVPVVESYGMTEAAHQMASNPLPPGVRKPGSVGLAAGPRFAILDEAGVPLQTGCIGEVAIMGANVMRGYEENPEANADAFCAAGWFRTGDQGFIDGDGYLFLTGRLKELINRGGEKIAPREIDEALLAHRAVRQAVAFAVPHSTLGEDIAAAVVLCEGASCSEAELRAFLLERLSAFKVPSRVIFVDEVPKGATGKVQRIGMADRLAHSLRVEYEAPASEMETRAAATICEVLGLKNVGRADNFFALGGDSLRAMQVLARLGQELSLELPPTMLFRLPTPALFGGRIEELAAAREVELLVAALAALPASEQARILEEARGPAQGP